MIFSNEELILVLSFSISFFITFVTVPWLIPRLINKNVIGKDMNKENCPVLPEMGGISIILGFFIGVYVQMFTSQIFYNQTLYDNYLLASLLVLSGISILGVIDDLVSISQRIKALLPFFFSLHLGIYVDSTLKLPFFGVIDFGLFMLILVPIAVTCASNSMNMLEGFNGLSCGMSLIMSATLILICVKSNEMKGLFILCPLLGCLIAFMYYNRYPASIFPGDTMTLFVGGAIACSAIVSNLKLEGFILFLPFIAEFFLKIRGNFKAQCFATKVNEGILFYDGRIESLTHFFMSNFKLTEPQLVYIFLLIEVTLSVIVLIFSFLQ